MEPGFPRHTQQGQWARAALGAAWLAGVMLRVEDLGTQVVVGDELHGVRAAASQEAAYIATHNHLPGAMVDYSIPMALWNLLVSRTIGLEEWGMRLPVLGAGILLMVAGSLFVWGAVGRFEGVVVGWWSATSPLLLYYSRFARPYVVAALLTFLALLGWRKWQRGGGWLAGLAAAGCGGLAIWFSLTSLPSVLGLWGMGLIVAIAGQAGEGVSPKAGWRQWFVVVLAGVCLAAALLAPSFAAQGEFVASVQARGTPTASSWWRAAKVIFGTPSDAVLVWLLATTLLGAWWGLRHWPATTLVFLLMLVGQVVAVYAVQPFGAAWPLVQARYVMAAVPGLLVLTCLGLCAQARFAGAAVGRSGVAPAAAAVLLGVTVASGWLPPKYRLAHVDTSNLFESLQESWSTDPAHVPRFYATLARSGDEVTILEWPWLPLCRHYQDRHGKRLMAISDEAFPEPAFRFRSLISPESALEGGADFDYVVVHKEPLREWKLAGGKDEVRDGEGEEWVARMRAWAAASIAACRSSGKLREMSEDEWTVVFANTARR
jgi:hypothetical protein